MNLLSNQELYLYPHHDSYVGSAVSLAKLANAGTEAYAEKLKVLVRPCLLVCASWATVRDMATWVFRTLSIYKVYQRGLKQHLVDLVTIQAAFIYCCVCVLRGFFPQVSYSKNLYGPFQLISINDPASLKKKASGGDTFGREILAMAVFDQDVRTIETLIVSGKVNPNKPSDNVLRFAVWFNRTKAIAKLLSLGARHQFHACCPTYKAEIPLLDAIQKDATSVVITFLKNRVDPNEIDFYGMTPLAYTILRTATITTVFSVTLRKSSGVFSLNMAKLLVGAGAKLPEEHLKELRELVNEFKKPDTTVAALDAFQKRNFARNLKERNPFIAALSFAAKDMKPKAKFEQGMSELTKPLAAAEAFLEALPQLQAERDKYVNQAAETISQASGLSMPVAKVVIEYM